MERREIKINFFHQIIFDYNVFIKINEFDKWVLNFEILTRNRNINFIYLISSDILELILANHFGLCIFPVVNSETSKEFELLLLEKYITKAR
jgi:hypothetical protein